MQNIVVGVNGSGESLDALRWIQAVAEPTDRIRALYAFQYPIAGGTDPSIPYETIRSAAEQRLKDILADVAPGEAERVGEVAKASSPAWALVEASEGADLLVVGTRRYSTVERAFVGSVALQCAQHARCPFIGVPEGAVATDGPIAVAYDGSGGARNALAAAGRLSIELGRPLVVLSVWQRWEWDAGSEPPLTADMEAQVLADVETDVAELAPDADTEIRLIHSDSAVAQHLLAACEAASILVMGSRGHGGFTGLLLGSVSQRCLESSTIPVGIVPA